MQLLLISNNNFSVYGGYEKVIKIIFDKLRNQYNFKIKILSLVHYRSLLPQKCIEEFNGYEIEKDAQYCNKLVYNILKVSYYEDYFRKN